MEHPGVQSPGKHAGHRAALRAETRHRRPKTEVQFNSCVYVDPRNGDIYSVENDIGDSIVVFKNDANGDVEPIRKLNITHRGYAMAVDEENQEFYLSVQYPPQVAVYRKEASGNENPSA